MDGSRRIYEAISGRKAEARVHGGRAAGIAESRSSDDRRRAIWSALYDLIRIGLMTGARLNELCELQVSDLIMDERAIRIRAGKTESAIRIIPAHASVWPILARRFGAVAGIWLFPELAPGGPDGKRSWYASKRFTTFRRTTLGDDNSIDFHSLRRTFATYLERASTQTSAVNMSIIAELMGHCKPSFSLATYSDGLTKDDHRKAVAALSQTVSQSIMNAIMETQ